MTQNITQKAEEMSGRCPKEKNKSITNGNRQGEMDKN